VETPGAYGVVRPDCNPGGHFLRKGGPVTIIYMAVKVTPTGSTGAGNWISRILAQCLVMTFIIFGSSALADTRRDIGGGARVENVRIDAVGAGEDARIRLLIVNESQMSLHLLRVSSVDAKGSKIDTEVGPGKRIALDMLTIPSNETLNLETFHQRLFLTGLKRKLEAGREIVIRFHFLEGSLNTVAHVH
jgi:copper(I)-binding protein